MSIFVEYGAFNKKISLKKKKNKKKKMFCHTKNGPTAPPGLPSLHISSDGQLCYSYNVGGAQVLHKLSLISESHDQTFLLSDMQGSSGWSMPDPICARFSSAFGSMSDYGSRGHEFEYQFSDNFPGD